MKIENLTNDGLTFVVKDAEPVTVRPGETSDDVRFDADHPVFAAQLGAGNIAVSGRGAPKAAEPPAASRPAPAAPAREPEPTE